LRRVAHRPARVLHLEVASRGQIRRGSLELNGGLHGDCMAKFKPIGSRKVKDKRSNYGFIPCLIFVLTGLAIVFYLLYALLVAGK
jgi:hypothetical protein